MRLKNVIGAGFVVVAGLLTGIASAEAGVLFESTLTGDINFTFDGLGLNPANVTKVEVANSAFTSSGIVFTPDFWNYGLNLSINGLPGLGQTGSLSTVSSSANPYASVTDGWTIDFYSGGISSDPAASIANILNGTRARNHTVVSGEVSDLQLTLLSGGLLRAFGHLDVTDGIYHSVQASNPDVVLNDPSTKAALGAATGHDLTNVNLARFQFDALFDLASAGLPDSNNLLTVSGQNASLAVVPEPGTLALFAFGLIGLAVLRRRSMATVQRARSVKG